MQKNPIVLGILHLGRDPTACLIKDGKIVAMAEEERFLRIKHAEGYFPKFAIKFCLEKGNIRLEDVDCISIGWDANAYPQRMAIHFLKTWHQYPTKDKKTLEWEIKQLETFNPENYTKEIINQLIKCGYKKDEIPEIVFKPHHYCHALSAYLASGFKEASILIMDGHGEENATTLWHAKGNILTKIKEINIPHSLGWFYAAFTKFTGFEIYDGEGKTMGLAPYGKPNKKFRENIRQLLKINEDGYEIDPSYLFYGKRTIADEFSDKFADIFGEYRQNDKADIREHHKDAAYEAQQRLEEVGLHLAEILIRKTGCRNLCLAGGVGLNCKLNGYIYRSEFVDNIFIQPVSGDDGTVLGAGMAIYFENGLNTDGFKMNTVYFGPDYSNEEIEAELKNHGLNYNKLEEIEKITAKLLSEGKIVGWFQGRMEVGPRALGARSILADPRDAKMKDKLNAKVKFRESWRPFCPSILYEDISEYLEKPCFHPFMILTFNIKEGMRSKIPSVVHIDGTARPQTVRKEDNERYWKSLNEFKKLTGTPVVLNTSFNIKGEPIVCSPKDAIDCFLKTGIDVLAIGDFIVKK